jgi:DNA-binding response OmpR family regulator
MGENSDRNQDNQEVRAGPLVLNVDLYTVVMRGRKVAVTPLEFDILLYLMQNSHRVVPQRELVQSVTRGVYRPDSSQVRVHIFHLRTKLGRASPALQTVRGRGLWFDARQLADRSSRRPIRPRN